MEHHSILRLQDPPRNPYQRDADGVDKCRWWLSVRSPGIAAICRYPRRMLAYVISLRNQVMPASLDLCWW